MPSTIRSRKNLILVLIIVFVLLLAAAIRVGYIQLVKGEEYKERALSQQTTDITVEAERGTIYDCNGEKLAQSVKCYDVYVYPAEIGKNVGPTIPLVGDIKRNCQVIFKSCLFLFSPNNPKNNGLQLAKALSDA